MKIIPAGTKHEIDHTVSIVYGSPGAGKTTFALGTEKPLLLDFDRGAPRAVSRNTARIVPKKWTDITGLSHRDLAPFETLVVDTAGTALDLLAVQIIEKGGALKDGATGGLSLKGYGALKTGFEGWVRRILLAGLDLVLVAHSTEVRIKERTVVRLDVTGGSKDLLHRIAHIMGYCYAKGGQRIFAPSPTSWRFGKNPAGLPDVIMERDGNQLGEFIAQTKQALIGQGQQVPDAGAVEVDLAAKLNAELEGLKKSGSKEDKRKLLDRAQSVGLAFNRQTKQFEMAA